MTGRQAAPDPSLPYAEELTVLRTLGGRNLLFSETRQAIYELDARSADAWRAQHRQSSPDRPGNAFREDPAPQLGPAPMESAEPAALHGLMIEACGVAVHLDLPDELVALVRESFGNLLAGPRRPDLRLAARLIGQEVLIDLPGGRHWRCAIAEFLPLLKAELVEAILRRADYAIAFHAAALARGSGLLLLVGSPGAGKSTLATALVAKGLGLAADDVVLMDRHGMLVGLPFPLAAKESGWAMLSRHWPDLLTGAVHRRPDGQQVRFLKSPSAQASRRLGRVALLDRRPHGGAHIEDVEPLVVLTSLIAEADSPDHRLSAAGFSSLVDALGTARCCRIVYSDAVEAAELLCNLHD